MGLRRPMGLPGLEREKTALQHAPYGDGTFFLLGYENNLYASRTLIDESPSCDSNNLSAVKLDFKGCNSVL